MNYGDLLDQLKKNSTLNGIKVYKNHIRICIYFKIYKYLSLYF